MNNPIPHFSAETAQQATEVAAKLSPTMRDAILKGFYGGYILKSDVRPNTAVALIDRALISALQPHPEIAGREVYYLTSLGKVVLLVARDGADSVLAQVASQDTVLGEDDMRQVVAEIKADPAPHREIDQVDDMREVVAQLRDEEEFALLFSNGDQMVAASSETFGLTGTVAIKEDRARVVVDQHGKEWPLRAEDWAHQDALGETLTEKAEDELGGSFRRPGSLSLRRRRLERSESVTRRRAKNKVARRSRRKNRR